jgi:hypothetical protein
MQKLATYLANNRPEGWFDMQWDQNVWMVWGRFVWYEIEVEEAAFSLGAHA